MKVNELTEAIIGAASEVHREIGPGLLESSYKLCLCRELHLRGTAFECEKPVALDYKRVRLDCGYRADLVVAQTVLVEAKALETRLPIHDAQLLRYLKLGGWHVGLLINFNARFLKYGIRRKVLDLREEFSL